MYDKSNFESELKKVWPTVEGFRPIWYRAGSQAVEIQDAWEMYTNARTSNLSELLLGDVKLRSQLEVLKNFGTTSGTESTMERGTLFGDKRKKITQNMVTATVRKAQGRAFNQDQIAHIRKGSVLNDGWWWPFKNDAWVVGGVHGLKRFHLTMGSVDDDLIWDRAAGRPRVLGRELLGLAAAGYALIGVPSWAIQAPPRSEVAKAPDPSKVVVTSTPVAANTVRNTIGMVFAPQSAAKATALTFSVYYSGLAKVKSIDDIKNGILGKEVEFEKYDFSKI